MPVGLAGFDIGEDTFEPGEYPFREFGGEGEVNVDVEDFDVAFAFDADFPLDDAVVVESNVPPIDDGESGEFAVHGAGVVVAFLYAPDSAAAVVPVLAGLDVHVKAVGRADGFLVFEDADAAVASDDFHIVFTEDVGAACFADLA